MEATTIRIVNSKIIFPELAPGAPADSRWQVATAQVSPSHSQQELQLLFGQPHRILSCLEFKRDEFQVDN